MHVTFLHLQLFLVAIFLIFYFFGTIAIETKNTQTNEIWRLGLFSLSIYNSEVCKAALNSSTSLGGIQALFS